MNPKFIITSLAGISVLGGAVTSCYYYCGQKNSEKQKEAPNSEELTTTKVDNPKSQENVSPSASKDGQEATAEQGQPLKNQSANEDAQTSPIVS